MAKLNKEAVGQYNYVVADDTVKSKSAFKSTRNDPNADASVDLVVKHPKHLQLIKLDPPKLFETSYHSSFRAPPKENLVCQKEKIDEEKKYTQYGRKKIKSASAVPVQRQKDVFKPKEVDKFVEEKNKIMKSWLDRWKPPLPPRAKTAEPAVSKSKPRWQDQDQKAAEFQRDIVKGRPDWKHKEEKSYDILNPEQPKLERETKPYGSFMENMQENVAQKYMEDDDYSQRSASSASSYSQLRFKDSRPQTFQSRSRGSFRSSSSRSDKASHAGERILGDDAFNQLCTIIEEDDENDAQPQTATPAAMRQSVQRNASAPDRMLDTMQTKGKSRVYREVRKPKKPVNLYERRAPDKRFYRSKVRQTPNEMNQFKKMRNRTFFKPLEQAIHEKDYVDHEAKYEPERQLLKDARWRIRQDLKDVRTKNINSLVDRFGQRAKVKSNERRQRLGLPTYAGRDPVSIYKLHDTLPDGKSGQPVTDITVNLAPRQRITPSIGSVQRARNLSTYANVWNQPSAPPYWGPQKVDHGLFLPPMAVNT